MILIKRMNTPDVLTKYGMTVQEFTTPLTDGTLIRQWLVKDEEHKEVAQIETWKAGRRKLGNISWPAKLTAEQASSAQAAIQETTPNSVANTDEEDHICYVDSPTRFVGIDYEHPKRQSVDLGVNVIFDSRVEPDDQTIKRAFSLTNQLGLTEASTEEITDALMAISLSGIRRPLVNRQTTIAS